ncbi:epoxide hydrolase [Moelleriella libera RCEF 2490]|uniref:Epoxide hydrolase n=1 Tax=Moelleriella libera RCEF 2490 TaxID=1081109 RepID=A0A166UTT4_9HYPO|nr:epoxide hydrolase [Moelleriella libera RCEF 2490]
MASLDATRLPPWHLPDGITSRFVDTSPTSLKFHILEALPGASSTHGSLPPLILLLHGFPNLSYDWRFVMPKLAAAGYYAVAVDLRGFGRTHNANLSPLDDGSIRASTATLDIVALVRALGYSVIHTLVGQDLGAYVAATTTLMRPDMVKSLVLMAHTWKGIPDLPVKPAPSASLAPAMEVPEPPWWETTKDPAIHASLAKLEPPRQHYKWYNASPDASRDWTYPTGQPLRDFLKGYFFLKSGGGASQQQRQTTTTTTTTTPPPPPLPPPRPLRSWTADELAVMPHYYIMRAGMTVRQNVALDMKKKEDEPPRPAGSVVVDSRLALPWLSEADLDVYEQEYTRTTFRAPLRWYHALTDPDLSGDLAYLAGAKIAVPVKYVSGLDDWGTYQVPGGLEAMQQGFSVDAACWRGATLVPGAGHWVNMEKPDESASEILKLAASVA